MKYMIFIFYIVVCDISSYICIRCILVLLQPTYLFFDWDKGASLVIIYSN